MKLRFALAAVGLTLLFAAWKISPPVGAKSARNDQPTPYPDRVILTWVGDPARSAAVTWRTDTSVTKAKAQIAVADDGPAFAKRAVEIAAASARFRSNAGEAINHSVRFTDLKPATLYAYRVGDGASWTEWHQFRTASDKPEPLTFLYVGDAQNDILSLWSRVVRMGYARAPEAHFFIHAGDLVNRGSSDEEWGDWFRAGGWIHATIPSFPVAGNHEYDRRDGNRRLLTDHWRAQFTLPENGVPGLEESNYYVDVQGVRVVALNANERQQEQAAWLDEVLSRDPQRWTVLTFHQPIYSTARSRDNKELRETWQPVFDKHAVDLVLQGHDHTYARSNLMTGVNARGGKAGTVYVVSVSGPKMYENQRQPWMIRKAEDTQLFQVIRIDGESLRYESRTARGILYDAFELRKRKRGPNQLVNLIPDTPERLRGAMPDSGAE